MANGLYDGSLESIPGLGGFLQQTRLNRQSDTGNLQNGVAIMGLLKEQRAQQDDAAVRQTLASDLPMDQKIMALVKNGPQGLAAAQHVMTINQAQQSMDALKGLNMTGGPGSDPAQMERVGTMLAASGHPGGAAILSLAKTLRGQQADTAEHAAQASTPTPITEAPQTGYRMINGQPVVASRANLAIPEPAPGAIPPEVQAAMDSGKPFSFGVGPSSHPAENTQNTGGAFSHFYTSPISVIPRDAAAQQAQLDASNPLSISPKSWNDKATAMGAREGTLINSEDNRALQQTIANQRNDTGNRRIDVNADLRTRAMDMNRGNILLRMGQNEDGSLNPNGEARAQLIAKGLMSATAQDRGLMARVQEINPKWSNADYQVNLMNEKLNGPGKKGDKIRSFSVAIDHLHTLNDLTDALDNGDIQIVNRLGNYLASQTGKPAPTNFNAAKALVADEIVNAVIGAGGALGDRETAQATLSAANSPAQIKGVIDTYERLMSGQLRGLHQQYVSSGGTKDFNSFLSDEAKAAAAAHPVSGTAPKMGGDIPGWSIRPK